jgi:hypothetical protein
MKPVIINHQRVFSLLCVIAVFVTQSAFSAPIRPAAPTAANVPVEINFWYIHNYSWINSPYSCRDPQKGCYVAINYKVESWIVSQKSVLIDPSWKDPKLVFWTKYISRRFLNYAYVEIQVEGTPGWARIKTYGGTNFLWHQVALDLKAYSGKKILVKFYSEPNLVDVGGQDFSKGHKSTSHPSLYNYQLFYVQGVAIYPEAPTP